MGEYAITNSKNDILKTLGLSSCVALTLYDPGKSVLGMVHMVLPESPDKPVLKPFYYADRAIQMLVKKLCMAYGCQKSQLEVKFFGGAQSIRKNDCFNIGRKNTEKVKAVLSELGLKPHYSDIGGHFARSIAAEVVTGTVEVTYQPLRL